MLKRIRKFPKEKKGSFIPIFGISALVLMLATGVALDYTRSAKDRARVQDSLDSAAMAVASEVAAMSPERLATLSLEASNNQTLEGQYLKELAQAFFEANLSSGEAQNVTLETRIEPVTDRKYKITVRGIGQTPTTFLKIANRDAIRWQRETTSLVEIPSMELTIVTDISVSMRYTDIIQMKIALNTLIDSIFKSGETNNLNKVSLVPFAESVNFGMAYKPWLDNSLSSSFADEFHGCFRPEFNPVSRKIEYGYTQPYKYLPFRYSNSFGYPFCPPDKSRVELFSSDPTRLKSRINGLTKAYGTGSGIGTIWGMRTLLPSWRGRFLETNDYPKDFEADGEKFLILMTDGRPIQFDAEGDGKYSGLTWYSAQLAVAADAFVKACDAIKAQAGTIHVYAIGYRFGTAGTTAKQNLKNCVHGSGKFYEADLDTLNSVFTAIGKDITRVRLGS